MRLTALVFLAVLTVLPTANAQRRVFAEIFTNSHCGPCASMHAAVDAHITTTQRDERVVVVYYHLPVYLDDPIYQANTVQPMQRAQVLGGVSGTPTTFFDGLRQTGGYHNWPVVLDALLDSSVSSTITATMSLIKDSVVIDYTVELTGARMELSLYAVVVEDITYRGRNGVSDHSGAMRALLTPVTGYPLEFDERGRASGRLQVPVGSSWSREKLRGVISLQGPGLAVSYDVLEIDPVTTNIDEAEVQLDEGRVFVHSMSGNLMIDPFATFGTIDSIRGHIASLVPSGFYCVRVERGLTSEVHGISVVR